MAIKEHIFPSTAFAFRLHCKGSEKNPYMQVFGVKI
jgi:hypothetical protein